MKVLFVDAGNYCRSPVAEIVARTIAAQTSGDTWLFASAGLKDKHAGDHADPRSIEACAARGYDLSAFRCREITPDDFRQHDVILAMDRENLRELETRRPAGCEVPIQLFLGESEVPDTYYGGEEGFVTMMDAIEARLREMLGG